MEFAVKEICSNSFNEILKNIAFPQFQSVAIVQLGYNSGC